MIDDSTNLHLIEVCLRSIFYLLIFFVIIRIIGFWISNKESGEHALENKMDAILQKELLEDILKELKEKNKNKE